MAGPKGDMPDAWIRFSITEDINDDKLYCWPTPDFLTESLFHDFLVELVEIVSARNTQKLSQLLDCNSASWNELRKWNQRQNIWSSGDRTADIGPRVRERCEKSIGDFISLSPPMGKIERVDVRINKKMDPFGKIRREINQRKASRESDTIEEAEEGQDICVNEDEEQIDKDVQVNTEKPCYYPSQEVMAAILKRRIDTIMQHYHDISNLGDAFNDVEFAVYTARYRMLSDQTEKRIRHPEAGVLSKEKFESGADNDSKKRMFMYILSEETKENFQKLKKDVQNNPKTLFVIIADECHWGITKDKDDKFSAHNLFINEWCKGNSQKNVIVVQISATPFNLLTKNSRLPEVRCILGSKRTSTIQTDEDNQEDDLIVLKEEEPVEKPSKEVELHVVHWSELELKNFESGMRMKLRSTLNINGASNQYLRVSSEGKLVVLPIKEEATDFIVQGSHGMVILKVLATNGQQPKKTLTVGEDEHGNLEANDDPQRSSKFEIKLEFGVGIVAFCSCENPDLYIAVNEIGQVSLQAAKVKRKWGVSTIEPKYQDVKVSCEFYTDQCRPSKADVTWQQYMSLNYYLSTMNCSNKKDQKIREDDVFQGLVEEANFSDSSPYPIDAILCAEYCYYIIQLSVYDSDEKVCQALMSLISDTKEFPALDSCEFQKRLDAFLNKLKSNSKAYIHSEAFELVQERLCNKAASEFQTNLKKVASPTSSEEKRERFKKSKDFEVLVGSFVACLMYLPRQQLQKIIEENHTLSIVQDIRKYLQENGFQPLIKTWNSIVEESETFSLVTSLIHSGKGNHGKMKIVRARNRAAADKFHNTLRLVREVARLEKCFEVIRDYGGIQIEKQMMKFSSSFCQKLQPDICMYKSDCGCSERVKQPPSLKTLKCANCDHVHKLITQYEDLENLACVLILVEKGRMGDTFPQSFDCYDLRLNYDSSHLSTLIQELGRLCRYVKVSASETSVRDTPCVLVGPGLFKTLKQSLDKSPSINAVSCSGVDRYMAKIPRSKPTTSYSWRWPDYAAQKDSFDYENQEEHKNRILLQAEPQIGKTGAYLCLIKLLRQDIVKENKVPSASTAASDEGILYCRKECYCSTYAVTDDNDGKDDWQFPYWKTIQNSENLSEKPVKEGKYSIRGQFYTHEMNEFPYNLLDPEQPTVTKSIPHPVKSDCKDGMRAWNWYHFKNCFQCRSQLQDKTSVLETIEAKIDDVPIKVRCSVPKNHASYKNLLEHLMSTKPTEEAFPKLNMAATEDDATALTYWIFHPSHRDDPAKCTLNYHHVMQENGQVTNCVQIVVVRSEKFESYRSFWGKVLAILELPDEQPNAGQRGCKLGPEDAGVGYARLFIQKLASFLKLEYVFVIDDNVVVMKEAEFESITDDISIEGNVSRKGNGVMRMKRCSFAKPLKHLEKIAQGKDTPPREEEEYEPHPLKEQLPDEASRYPLYSYTGPAKLYQDKQHDRRQHDSYGVLGLLRSVPNAVKPFSKTQVYAVILLNVKSTVEKKVFYRPWPFWEDLRFNDDCDKEGLWVVKCNRYHFQKFLYNDWLTRLVPPSIFEWKDDTILEDKPKSSKIPKDLEEGLILEHLGNIVSNEGPERCFKECIECDAPLETDDTISPLRILQKVEAANETDAKEIPVLILPNSVTNLDFDYRISLFSRFCSTNDKIVFVVSAEEALERWSGMKLASIVPTKKGICFSEEMEQRNATFSIFSAADPTKNRLRYIVIEASFPQDRVTTEEASNSIAEENSTANNQENAKWETDVEKPSSSKRPQDTKNENKGRKKRCLQNQSNDSVQPKKRKKKDGNSHSDLIPTTGKSHLSRYDTTGKKGESKSVVKVKGKREAHKTSHTDSDVQRKKKAKQMKGYHKKDNGGVSVPDGHGTGSEKLSPKQLFGAASTPVNEMSPSELQNTFVSGDGHEQYEGGNNKGNVNLMLDEEMTPIPETNDQPKTDDGGSRERERKKGPKLNPDHSAYFEGTNDVTGKLVELWIKYRNIPKLSKESRKEDQKEKKDLTKKEVRSELDSFLGHEQLNTKDEMGYTPLLKACSLPTMSPHVMQYLVEKVDKEAINCCLPSTFKRDHPAGKELVPGMSALSVAIRSRNVKSVPTFTKRHTDINVRSKDDKGNTALHHCFLALSKTSYEKLFPLFKPLEWKEMRNKEGKNPLDVCVSQMQLKGLSKEKEKFLDDARKEMEKDALGDDQNTSLQA